MSSLNTEEQTLAKQLAHARSTGTNVQPQTSPANLDRAYAIQNEVSRLLGGTSRGWKVGSTSRAAQERLGTSEPGAGRLLTPWVCVSGESVAVSAQHDAQVEVEFGFVMGTTLSPRAEPYTAADVRAAIASFVPALEIVGSRLERGLAGSGRELVTADGGANIGFVYGDPFKCDIDADFAAHACSLSVNGSKVADGTGANALDDPLNVLAWLANFLSKRGDPLEAGLLVTTGTCTGLVDVAPGDHLVGDFGAWGKVEATIVAREEST